mgnify:FL=1
MRIHKPGFLQNIVLIATKTVQQQYKARLLVSYEEGCLMAMGLLILGGLNKTAKGL